MDESIEELYSMVCTAYKEEAHQNAVLRVQLALAVKALEIYAQSDGFKGTAKAALAKIKEIK